MIFECHITVARPDNQRRLEALAVEHGWKTSFIEGDPLLGKQGFFYFTSYHTSLVEMKIRMHEFADLLPVPVLRKKIEEIVYDTKKLVKEAA